MTGTIKALVGCQNEYCATEVSYYLDMVRLLSGEPICQNCYEDGDYCKRDEDGELTTKWCELSEISLEDLKA